MAKTAHSKFIASQARSIHQYKNLKIKVLKSCADIFFNRQCLITKTVPHYMNIKVPITSPASRITKTKSCADIFFNRQSLITKPVPHYMNIKVPITSPASCITKTKSTRFDLQTKLILYKKRKTN